MKEMAQAAESLGYDAISVHDHLNWGPADRYHFYAGTVETADATEEPYDFYDAFLSMAYLAAITKHVRIIPAAMCLAWRHPLAVARQASTLYALSDGRFELGVCPGNVQRDFEVTGTSWDDRGSLTEESLQILRLAIDSEGPISFEGRHYSFSDAEINPRPVGLKLYYGGTSKAAVRRAGQYCEGWMPGGGPAYFSDNWPKVRERASQRGLAEPFQLIMLSRLHIADGRDEAMAVAGRTLDYQGKAEWLKRHDLKDQERAWLIGSPDRIIENLAEARDAGVTLVLHTVIAHTLEATISQMERFADEVMPQFRAGEQPSPAN